jgi:hypothetical protein
MIVCFYSKMPTAKAPYMINMACSPFLNFIIINVYTGRFRWPRGLRRGSPTSRLLELWVQIPLRAWMSVVNVECCQGEVSATG